VRKKDVIKALEAIEGNPEVHFIDDDGATFEIYKVGLISIKDYRDPDDGYTEFHNVIGVRSQ
jgi:hypothetical protein